MKDIREFDPGDFECSRDLLEYVNDGIYITDNEANTIYANHRYELISGLARSEILGKNMKDMVEDGIISQSGTLAVLRDGKSVSMEQSFRTGKRALIKSSPVWDGEGENRRIIMVITVVSEVTEIYMIRRELERLRDQNKYYQNEIAMLEQERSGGRAYVAEDRSSREVMRLVSQAALLDDPVFISGQAGTGREFTARAIHDLSRRNVFPFLKIDFSVMPAEGTSKYLFGYMDPGTGEYKPGILDSAAGGTVYISEIDDIPADVRSRFLGLLSTGECVLGDGRLTRLDLRFIIGSHYDMQELARRGNAGDSLMKALLVIQIHLKPLRERTDDILPLADYFLQQVNAQGETKKTFSADCVRQICAYSWPGNVEEMRVKIRRAALVSRSGVIEPEDLFLEEQGRTEKPAPVPVWMSVPESGSIRLKEELARIEAACMAKAFARYGNARQAARSLGMDSSTFVRKRQKYVKMGLMDNQ